MLDFASKRKEAELRSGIVRNNSFWDKVIFRKIQVCLKASETFYGGYWNFVITLFICLLLFWEQSFEYAYCVTEQQFDVCFQYWECEASLYILSAY